ncbi:MAG TPA: hypothetical protein VE291_09285 [Terracidiphilus sp.]|jgi:hypothetical protein|nr:hypothetical protein [Terracidiphilus sp.]
MNRYILIRRLTGPSILLLLGVVALLHEADLVNWGIFVPLLLILLGALKLAQRAALAAAGDEPYQQGAYPGAYQGTYQGYNGGYPPNYGYGAQPPAQQPVQQPGTQPIAQPTGTSLVPTPPHDLTGGSQGGQS